ncbi:Mbeg1-like protein [Allofustis seminis]|uniref:Mbeg1-like protein n=1 Tax=Allofustis seminis TaxID=166939 RepID=UPI000376FE4E|nr:Mbeg1-like protein [Allofustis seminis]
MITVMDYVKEVGHLSFIDCPYTEMDMMVLLDISYLPFELWVPSLTYAKEIAPPSRKWLTTDKKHPLFISVQTIYHEFCKKPKDYYLKNHLVATEYRQELLKVLAHLPRYQHVQFGLIQTKIAPKQEMDYSSLVFILPGVPEQFVAFRGSNASFISWMENVTLLMKPSVPAHRVALEYLADIFNNLPGPFVITGHSKGGHLALFAAFLSDYNDAPSALLPLPHKVSTDCIKKVMNFDGPGLAPDLAKKLHHHPLCHKTQHYIPEAAIVGSRLCPLVVPDIISSYNFSVFQHNLRFWKVDATYCQLMRANDISPWSHTFNDTYEKWAQEFEPDEILAFYRVLFQMLKSMGYASFNEIDDDIFTFLRHFKSHFDALNAQDRALIDRIGYRFLVIAKDMLIQNSTLFSTIQTTQQTTHHAQTTYETMKDTLEHLLKDWLPPWH